MGTHGYRATYTLFLTKSVPEIIESGQEISDFQSYLDIACFSEDVEGQIATPKRRIELIRKWLT